MRLSLRASASIFSTRLLDAQIRWRSHRESLQLYLAKVVPAPGISGHVLARGTAVWVHLEIMTGIDEQCSRRRVKRGACSGVPGGVEDLLYHREPAILDCE